MKLITAIIKPARVDDVREALAAIGVHAMTVSEVRGFGQQKGRTDYSASETAPEPLIPKLKVEIAVETRLLEPAIETVVQAARAGRIGDGKIFVVDLERGVRVRTGETGPTAL